MKVIRHGRNVHEIQLSGPRVQLAVISDAHWDNVNCQRDILKKHLDYCLEHNITVIMPGDTFCLMQGRGDRRSSKSDLRPEHKTARYLDAVIETAVDWFSPYAKIIAVISYGNHETSIIKWQETDVLQRFVDLLNYKNGTQIQVGGYGGWVIVRQKYNGNSHATTKIKYFHGSGGGGIVTKGAINLTRAKEMCEDFDVFTMGHIHENSCRTDERDTIVHTPQKGYKMIRRSLHLMITGTYKEEYEDGFGGWHIERGAPPKPIGGRILVMEAKCPSINGERVSMKNVDSMKFPL